MEQLLFVIHIPKNLEEKNKRADILISSCRKVKLCEAVVKDGSVVVDIGINRVDGKLVGDVDFENVKNSDYITHLFLVEWEQQQFSNAYVQYSKFF